VGGSSNPEVDLHSELSSSLKSMVSEAGLYRISLNIPFNRDKCELFHYFAILNRWVCLKEREFKYSKFQQLINSTTHHILDLGGSSIP
jgi:hypothetical protein